MIDETGLFLNPVVRRTSLVISHIPGGVADYVGRHDTVSVIGGFTHDLDGTMVDQHIDL